MPRACVNDIVRLPGFTITLLFLLLIRAWWSQIIPVWSEREALNNASAKSERSIKEKLSLLTSPLICLDGINEKGVSIAVLTLDSKPVNQDTGKMPIIPTIAIRLALDRAATTEEAVELLRSYDMFAAGGRDYHYYITDASGDGRVVEYD